MTGTIDMSVSGVGSDMSSAVADGIGAASGAPPPNTDVAITNTRRLQDRRLADEPISVRVHYFIVVDSNVPSNVALTGSEMGQLFQASNRENITAAILAGLQGTHFSSENITVSVKEIGAAEAALINVATSTSSPSTSSTKAVSMNGTLQATQATTTGGVQLETTDRASMVGVSQFLLLLFVVGNLLF